MIAAIEDLIKYAAKYALHATERKDRQLLERSNDLLSLFKTKEDELKKLN